MPPFVVDASMTLSWCFWDEATPHSRAVLTALQTTYAVVPALWPFEIASGLAIAERRKRISQDQIAEFLETLRRLPIQVERREAVWLCQATIEAVLGVAQLYRDRAEAENVFDELKNQWAASSAMRDSLAAGGAREVPV